MVVIKKYRKERKMKKISTLVRDFLEETGRDFEQTDDKEHFKICFGGDNGSYSILVTIDDKDRLLIPRTMCPINVPKAKLPAVAELIARKNCSLSLGNFDIDMDDGLIFFRTGMKVGQIDLDHETLYVLVRGNPFIMDDFLPAIASVAYGNATAEEAITALEGSKRERHETRQGSSTRRRRSTNN